MENGLLEEKSFLFAKRIVKLYIFLRDKKKVYSVADQILRSGTSIGANIAEAIQAQSKSDFLAKNSIALKEAVETRYWLKLLYETDFITYNQFISMNNDLTQIIRLLISTCKTTEKKIKTDKLKN